METAPGLTSGSWIDGSLKSKSSGEKEIELLGRDFLEVCCRRLELVLVEL